MKDERLFVIPHMPHYFIVLYIGQQRATMSFSSVRSCTEA